MPMQAARPYRRHRTAPASALLARIQDELAVFRDRELGREVGSCRGCGKRVRSQQAYVREHGVLVHVRCRITRATRGARHDGA